MRILELETVLRSPVCGVQFCRLWSISEGKQIDCGSVEYIVKEHGTRYCERISANNNEIILTVY